jgi:uncharacterized membrane protein YGL010W
MLSPLVAFMMAIKLSLMMGACYLLEGQVNLLTFCIVLFVVSWIGQFWGHKVEGKKPSFFEDIQFLLIGPLWVLKAITGLPKLSSE